MDEQQPSPPALTESPALPAPEKPAAPTEVPVKNRWRANKLEKLKCWGEILAMLENGDQVDDIATFIQVQRNEYTEVGRASLIRVIYLWIKRHRELVPDRVPMIHMQLASSSPRIDEIEGLNMVLAIQMDRVSYLYEDERRRRVHNPRLERELRLAKDILDTMASVSANQKRYSAPAKEGGGSVISQIEQLRAIYSNKYGAAVARVILADESRRKVLNAMEHLRKGNSQALQSILDKNATKAEELKEKERQRVKEEATVIDIDVEQT